MKKPTDDEDDIEEEDESDEESDEDDGMASVCEEIQTLTGVIARAVKSQKIPTVNITQAAQLPPSVNVEVPEMRQADGFNLKFTRDSRGQITAAECRFVWK